jgi:hypothetical protein
MISVPHRMLSQNLRRTPATWSASCLPSWCEMFRIRPPYSRLCPPSQFSTTQFRRWAFLLLVQRQSAALCVPAVTPRLDFILALHYSSCIYFLFSIPLFTRLFIHVCNEAAYACTNIPYLIMMLMQHKEPASDCVRSLYISRRPEALLAPEERFLRLVT